ARDRAVPPGPAAVGLVCSAQVPRVRVHTGAGRGRGRLLARRVPRVDGDRRRGAAVAEIADHQQVAGLVHAGEARAATDAVTAQGDRVLEEPEALLRVAAVVEAVRSEVQHLAL